MFIDEATIEISAGNGGSGCMSFHREKFVSKGGPNGGDGGKGGNVIALGDKGLHTLMDFRYKRIYEAERGTHGKGSNKTGKNGEDTIIRLPLGTIVRNAETNEVICEVVEHDKEVMIAQGGFGGRGNARFKSSTNRTPREWEVGQEGEAYMLTLELKLLADIGLVGYPNAGKSTLISVISAAKPKIADYPFTTLIPNLGIIKYHNYSSFVMADIPGLIEGAHTGKGLGHQFLRHVERTKGLLFLIDIMEEDFKKVYRILLKELKKHNDEILEKPRLIVITKLDVFPERKIPRSIDKVPVIGISSMSLEGLDHLKERCINIIENEK